MKSFFFFRWIREILWSWFLFSATSIYLAKNLLVGVLISSKRFERSQTCIFNIACSMWKSAGIPIRFVNSIDVAVNIVRISNTVALTSNRRFEDLENVPRSRRKDNILWVTLLGVTYYPPFILSVKLFISSFYSRCNPSYIGEKSSYSCKFRPYQFRISS